MPILLQKRRFRDDSHFRFLKLRVVVVNRPHEPCFLGGNGMQRSEQSIRTSHVGMLPGTGQSHGGSLEGADKPAEDIAALTSQVAGIVKRQRDLGIDCVGDGEFWTGRHFRFYGQQLSGITSRELQPGERASGRESTRERDAFPKLYADMDRVGTAFCVPGEQPRFFPAKDKMVVTGPIKCRATDAIRREIKVFKDALAAVGGVEEAFICVFAPGWLDHFIYDEHYNDDEEFVFALAEAMREEYRAVVDAGFILQIDDPGIATSWDMIRAGAHDRRIPPLSEGPRRCAQSRTGRIARRSHPPPLLLGQLARRTHA